MNELASEVAETRSNRSSGIDSETAGATGFSRPRRAWSHVVLVVVLTSASLVPVWLPEHFPSQNGPWFLSMIHMFKTYDQPEFNYSEFYQRILHPIPHILNSALVYAANHVLPLLTAEKIALSCYLLLLPISIFYFLSVVDPDRKILGYMAFLMVHTYSFYRGYFDFSLSVPLFFFSFAYWIRHRDSRGALPAVVIAVLVTLTYLAHLVAFAILAFCIGFYRLVETRSLVRALAAVLWATWPGWLLFAEYSLFTSKNATWIKPSVNVYHPVHTSVENFIRKYFYTVSYPAYVLGALPWLWVLHLLGRRLGWLRADRLATIKDALSDPLPALVTVLVVLYLVLPWKFLGWYPFNARMLPFIYGLALGCFGRLSPRVTETRFRAAFLSTVCAASIGVYGFLTVEVVRMDHLISKCLAGIEYFDQNSTLLPVFGETPRFGQVRPLRRAYEYYHIAKGGANGHGIAHYNTIVPLVYRTYPAEKVFPKFDKEEPENSIRRIEEVYDYVLVWGVEETFSRWIGRARFRLVFQNECVRLYRNQRQPTRSEGV